MRRFRIIKETSMCFGKLKRLLLLLLLLWLNLFEIGQTMGYLELGYPILISLSSQMLIVQIRVRLKAVISSHIGIKL